MQEQFENLESPITIYLIMLGRQVTSWSSDKQFAKACAGVGERVVEVSEPWEWA